MRKQDSLKRLQNIIDIKRGNKEMALFYHGENSWTLMVGNPSEYVLLGEVSGEFVTEGESLDDVITKMEIMLDNSLK